MKPLRPNPHLFEINARLWLARLSAQEGRALSLSMVPDFQLQALARRFDLLWLMGAWQRSPGARQRALASPEIIGAYDAALAGWTDADVAGSPYAIYDYRLDSVLGNPAELRVFRERLHAVGVRLVVDFVSNHLALDHPWTANRPDLFVGGDEHALLTRPGELYRTPGGSILAHGRDPNFSPWDDTVQVNLASLQARQALFAELLAIAEQADGVRCDTAMLGLSDVFARVWGWALPGHQNPAQEFWGELIGKVKECYPDFLFIAEAYWGVEGRLLELGFDYAYDKQLYDLLLGGSALELREHLAISGPLCQRRVRFIENQDEPRATAAFGSGRSQAAAIATMTLPGLRLVHDGQIEGKYIHLPLQLIREPSEPVDEAMVRFYDQLLALTNAPVFHEGAWDLVTVEPALVWDESYRNIVAWSWADDSARYLVAVNQSNAPAYGRLCQLAGYSRPISRWSDVIEPTQAAARAELCGTDVDVLLAPWSARILSGDTRPEHP